MSDDTKITPDLAKMGMVANVNCRTLKLDDTSPEMKKMRELAANYSMPFGVQCSDKQVFGSTPAVVKIDTHRDPQIAALSSEADNSAKKYGSATPQENAKNTSGNNALGVIMKRFAYDSAVQTAISSASAALSASGVAGVLAERQKDITPTTSSIHTYAVQVVDQPSPAATTPKLAAEKTNTTLKR